MSRPVFLIGPEELDGKRPGDLVQLVGPEAHHAVRVRRLRTGEQIDLVDGVGTRATAQVGQNLQASALQVEVTGVHHEDAPWPALALVQALGKGGRDEHAVEMSTEVGAAHITPWQAAHSVSQWRGAKVDDGRRRWRQIATAAAKQARRSHLPQVHPLLTGQQLLQAVRTAGAAGEAVLVLDERATTPIADAEVGRAPRITVVVGPEGGLSSGELTALAGAGAQPVRLGPHVLRTSSAGPIALALLANQLGHW